MFPSHRPLGTTYECPARNQDYYPSGCVSLFFSSGLSLKVWRFPQRFHKCGCSVQIPPKINDFCSNLCESAYVLFRPQGHIILLPEIHVSERPTKFVGPIDCLNLKSSFLPLTVYGRPAHQEGHRFCAHSLRRLFRCLLGRIPRRRIGLFSGWSVYPRRSRQEYCRRGNELTDCFFSFCSSTTFFSCTLYCRA